MGKQDEVDAGLRDGELARKESSTNTDSDRVLVTKRAVFRALCELMEEGDFAKISVGDILARSGVSRSTFYRCFADKYDVVNWSYKRYKNIRVKDSHQYYSFETSLLAQLDYLHEHQAFYAQALRYLGQNSLRDYIFETNEEYMLQCWHEAHGPEEPSFEQASAISFAAAGFAKTLELWVLGGCEQPEEDILRVIMASIPTQILQTLY